MNAFSPPLPLRTQTPAAWAKAALADPAALLSDHALVYRNLAEERFGEMASRRLEWWLDREAEVIQTLPWQSRVH